MNSSIDIQVTSHPVTKIATKSQRYGVKSSVTAAPNRSHGSRAATPNERYSAQAFEIQQIAVWSQKFVVITYSQQMVVPIGFEAPVTYGPQRKIRRSNVQGFRLLPTTSHHDNPV